MSDARLVLPLLALLLPAAVHADDGAALRQLVGDAEYRAMGLDKLSAEERQRLTRWLQARLAGQVAPGQPATVAFGVDGATLTATVVAPAAPTAVAPAAAPAVAPATAPAAPVAVGSIAAFGLDSDTVDGERTELRARIVGAFTGWDGKTLFTLDNGQVWRQSTPGTYRFKATDPEVIIEKALLGYKLRLVETRRSIAVRRVR